MVDTLIILLILAVIVFVFMKGMIYLNNHISELDRMINNIQYQIDDILCNINTVNENVLNNYKLLSKTEDKNNIN